MLTISYEPMPELPEVEGYRLYLEATSLHQPIEHIDVEDTKLLTTDQITLTEALHGARVYRYPARR